MDGWVGAAAIERTAADLATIQDAVERTGAGQGTASAPVLAAAER